MLCMTAEDPEGGLQRCGTETVEPRICFLQFLKSSGFKNYEENKMRGNGGAQSPSSCQKAHFPILGKVWSPGESCPVEF